MKYLNLTKGFDPYNKSNTIDNINFESFAFSGGEPHIKLKDFGLGATMDKGLLHVKGGVLTDQISWSQEESGDLKDVFIDGELLVDYSIDDIRKKLWNN